MSTQVWLAAMMKQTYNSAFEGGDRVYVAQTPTPRGYIVLSLHLAVPLTIVLPEAECQQYVRTLRDRDGRVKLADQQDELNRQYASTEVPA